MLVAFLWAILSTTLIFQLMKNWHLDDQLYISKIELEDSRASYRNRLIELTERQRQNDELAKEIRRLRGGQRKSPEETDSKSKKKNKDKSEPRPHPLEL